MSDLISRSALENSLTHCKELGRKTFEAVLNVIKEQPAIEAAPVVHGEWIDNGIPDSMLSRCSVCGFNCGAYSFNFCPNCGADMRGNEPIDEEDTKLVIDEDGVMYRVVSRERALKAIDKWEEVLKKRIDEMRGKEQV